MKLRKPEKQMQIYWSKRELDLIILAVQTFATEHDVEEQSFVVEDLLKKAILGVKAIDAYVAGDQYGQEILEIAKRQNETEELV